MQGVIFNIQRFCIHDGPGIRTTVFFKGCPLRCAWCHNPESQSLHIENMRENGKEEGCGMYVSVGEVMDEVLKDRIFYEHSNGGLTLSGGEPLMQPDFACELLREAKRHGLHTCVETCGFARAEDVARVAQFTDLFLYDWKLTNNEQHQMYTGVQNTPIWENLRYIDTTDAKIILRCPIIPHINDTDEHFQGVADMANSLKNMLAIEIEPYHSLGNHKYAKLGKTEALRCFEQPTEQQVDQWLVQLRQHTNVLVKKA